MVNIQISVKRGGNCGHNALPNNAHGAILYAICHSIKRFSEKRVKIQAIARKSKS
jgi:hypothetical protein